MDRHGVGDVVGQGSEALVKVNGSLKQPVLEANRSPQSALPTLVAIDDEAEFTTTIRQFFSVRGYEVHIALTGFSGIDLVERYRPQVVLVDLKLPGMDGDEILRRIRREYPSTRVIVITAYNDGGKTKDRLLALGAFAHFDKPLSSLRDLAQVIQRALQGDS